MTMVTELPIESRGQELVVRIPDPTIAIVTKTVFTKCDLLVLLRQPCRVTPVGVKAFKQVPRILRPYSRVQFISRACPIVPMKFGLFGDVLATGARQ